jgi:hypothetical protein
MTINQHLKNWDREGNEEKKIGRLDMYEERKKEEKKKIRKES